MQTQNLIRSLLAAAALCLSGTSTAQQVTTGGSFLARDLYKGESDSIMPANFSYTAVGSGNGKTAFLTNNSAILGASGSVHMIASESVLTPPQIAIYNSLFNSPGSPEQHGPIIQIPAFGTTVAFPFNRPGGVLSLSDQQLCRIFSGQVTNWAQLDGTSTAPLNVVYRPDGSGTTEVLTRFLNTVCASTQLGNTTLVGGQFSVTSNFQMLFVNQQVPSNFISGGSSGDAGVYNTILVTSGAIGYTGPDMGANINDPTKVARVRGFSANEVSVPATFLMVPPPTTPAEVADATRWAPVFPNPIDGYPVVAYSNLVLNQCYRDPIVASSIRVFLMGLYSGNRDLPIRAHWHYPLIEQWRNAIRTRFVLPASPYAINNTTVCNGIGRP